MKKRLFSRFFSKDRIIFCYFSFGDIYYTPLDIGYILARINNKKNNFKFDFFQHDLSRYETEEDLKKRILKEADIIEKKNPRAVFFFLDNIAWSKILSAGRTKKIAKELKKRLPSVYIGAQSHKFTEKQAKEMLSSGRFDCLIGNEPEHSFIHLEKMLQKKPVRGAIYSLEEKKMDNFFNSPENRGIFSENDNLDHIPSPYLTHILDEFLIKKQKIFSNNFTAFVYSSRGCRFGCYYCSRSVKFEKVRLFSIKRLYDEIEYIYNNFKIKRFLVLDDAFLFSKERLEKCLEEFENRIKKNKNLGSIRIFAMARAESLDEETVDLLRKINIVRIQIGLQTINPDIQFYMKRSCSIEKFKNISEWLAKNKIELALDIISGLPKDNIEYFKKTIDFAIGLNPHTIQMKQFYLNPGTMFHAEQDKYGIKTETFEKDFYAPYVLETSGNVKNEYHKEAFSYTIKIAKQHPEIGWKIMTMHGSYFNRSGNFVF